MLLSGNVGVVYSGMGPDFRVLVRKARKRAQQYYQLYKENIPVAQLVQETAIVMQEFTRKANRIFCCFVAIGNSAAHFNLLQIPLCFICMGGWLILIIQLSSKCGNAITFLTIYTGSILPFAKTDAEKSLCLMSYCLDCIVLCTHCFPMLSLCKLWEQVI